MFQRLLTRKIKQIRYVQTQTPSTNVETAAAPKKRIVERWKDFWVNVYTDYTQVAKDVMEEAQAKPKKTIAILWTIATAAYCAKVNPDRRSYIDYLTNHHNELILVSEPLQNKKSREYFCLVNNSLNNGTLSILNLGVCSLLYNSACNEECRLAKYQSWPLKASWLKSNFYDSIIDVGFLGKWWVLEKIMIDYDVNDELFV